MRISVVAELERMGWAFEYTGDHGVKVRCPFHDDTNPSAKLDTETGAFKCFTAGCQKSSDFVGFAAAALKGTRAAITHDLASRYDLDEAEKIIEAGVIERAHRRIWQAGALLAELRKRGLDDDSIRRYRLGEDGGRITIPIPNREGLFVNVLRYLPGAPGKEKMRNTKGHSKTRLFPVDQLSRPEIVILGGPVKAIAAIQELRDKPNIGAVTTTGGEGSWHPSFTPAFAGKRVWILMDVDEPGRVAAVQIANLLARVASWVGVVELPLDLEKHPKGDINDYIAEGGKLVPLLDACEQFVPTYRSAEEDTSEPPIDVRLAEACSADSAGKRLRLNAVVTALDQAPYVVPGKVTVNCSRDTNYCAICPVYNERPDKVFSLSPEGPQILAMVNAHKSAQRDALMETIGVPRRCPACDFDAHDFYNVEDVRLSPRLDIASNSSDREMLPAVCVGLGIELNESYVMEGRMHPHPRHQQSTLVISSYKESRDALATYENEEDGLEIFQGPPEDKLSAIYEDLEANVTRIFQRRDLHLMVDLAYHSVLRVPFDGRLEKGWAEVLIVGDSAQGKTETATNLMRHYGVGVKVECKNASVAGLLGGLEQMSGKWFVRWGVIPTNDRRLVILEELKGASREVISKLTDMRSSGQAEIPKIERRRTNARTRLVAISNPRSDLPVSAHNYGIEIVQELVGGLEDVRRFDAAMVVARGEVDPDMINSLSRDRPAVPHVFTADLCRRLVLWAWTREPHQVIMDEAAQKTVLDCAKEMCSVYSDRIPLVDRGSQRYKLARLAAALAARLYSTEDGVHLIVREEHVRYVAAFLDRVYSSSGLGYKAYSTAVAVASKMVDEDVVQRAIQDSPFPRELVESLLHTSNVEAQDIQDWCGYDRTAAQQMISLFVRKRALVREGRVYRKTPEFIEFLRRVDVKDRPTHITEEEF